MCLIVYHPLFRRLAPICRRVNKGIMDVMEQLLSSNPGSPTSSRPAEASLAVKVGLPAEPGATRPFSDYSWASTPHLRLSREGRCSGQLLVSSGPPLRSETTRQRQLWEAAGTARLNVVGIKVGWGRLASGEHWGSTSHKVE